MPQWCIYKNDFKIGQSKTWHGAVAVLVKQENMSDFHVHMYKQFVQVVNHMDKGAYKIVKEN